MERLRSALRPDGNDARVRPTVGSYAAGSEFAGEHPKRPSGQETSLPAEQDGARLEPLELSLAGRPGAVPIVAGDPASPAMTGGRSVPSVPTVEAALVEQVVRRVVWGGDRRRGVARIELDGALAGTSIWLRGEGRALEVELVLGPGLEDQGLAERLLGRLRTRGIEVARCEVR